MGEARRSGAFGGRLPVSELIPRCKCILNVGVLEGWCLVPKLTRQAGAMLTEAGEVGRGWGNGEAKVRGKGWLGKGWCKVETEDWNFEGTGECYYVEMSGFSGRGVERRGWESNGRDESVEKGLIMWNGSYTETMSSGNSEDETMTWVEM